MIGAVLHNLLAIDPKNLKNSLNLLLIPINNNQITKNTLNINQMKDQERPNKNENPKNNQ
jgi:hypothetical protein